MADVRALVITGGKVEQQEAADTLLVGAGVKVSSGSLSITPGAGGNVTVASGSFGIGGTPSVKLHVTTGAAGTTAATRFQTTSGTSNIFIYNATPEAAVTGSPGDLAVDVTATTGGLYFKSTGSATNTGWVKISGDVTGPASSTNTAVAIFSGTTGKVLANSSVTISGSTITGTLSGNASTATSLSAGSAMAIPYQSSSGVTAYLAATTAGAVLTTQNTGSAPTWTAQSSLSVGTATNATNATNINLTASSTNSSFNVPFTATGSGNGALLTDVNIGYNPSTNTLTTGTFSGALSGNATSATTATHIANGGAGQIPYNTGSGATTFLAAGQFGERLRYGASNAPEWAAVPYYEVKAATTANVTLAGGAPNTTDSVSLAANDKILVKNQSAPAQNGVYYVSTLGTGLNGTWTRYPAANTSTDVAGAIVIVEQGTTHGGQKWTTGFKGSDTLGTTAMTWSQFSGDVTGPASSTDRAIAIYSGTGGKTLQNSGVVIDASSNVTASGTGPLDITVNATDTGAYSRMVFEENAVDKAMVQFVNSLYATTARRNQLEIINTVSTGNIAFLTQSAQRGFISAAGNIVWGTTTELSTGYKLMVMNGGGNTAAIFYSGAANLSTGIQVGRTASDGGLHAVGVAGNYVSGSAVADIVLFAASSTNDVRIGAGSGTASLVVGSADVTVNGTVATTDAISTSKSVASALYDGVSIQNTNSTGLSGLVFENNSGTAVGRLQFNNSSPNLFLTTLSSSIPLHFGINNAIAATISINSRLNIGQQTDVTNTKMVVNSGGLLYPIQALTGASGSPGSIAIGRTAFEADLGVSAGADNYFSGTVAGDGAVRVLSSSQKMFMGAGSTAVAVLSSTGASFGAFAYANSGAKEAISVKDHSAYADSHYNITTAAMQTTGASTNNDIFTLAVPDECGVWIAARVIGREASATSAFRNFYWRAGTVYREGGVAAQLINSTSIMTAEQNANPEVSIAVDGGNNVVVRINTTGITAGVIVNWVATIEYQIVKTNA